MRDEKDNEYIWDDSNTMDKEEWNAMCEAEDREREELEQAEKKKKNK